MREVEQGNNILSDPNMDSEGVIQPGLERPSLRDFQTLHFILVDAGALEAWSQVDLEAAPEPKPQCPAYWSLAKPTAQPSWMFKYKGSPIFLRRKHFKNVFPSLAVQWLGLHAFTAKDAGSIPGWGAEILQGAWRGVFPSKSQKQTNKKCFRAGNELIRCLLK